jgi:hypothetical protein
LPNPSLLRSDSRSFSTVAGGCSNNPGGFLTFAARRRTKIDVSPDGAILFADSTDEDFNSAAANEFAVRCLNGARFLSSVHMVGKFKNRGTLTDKTASTPALFLAYLIPLKSSLDALTQFASFPVPNVYFGQAVNWYNLRRELGRIDDLHPEN